MTLDGKPLQEARGPFLDDGREHEVVVALGVVMTPSRLTAGNLR